jgi:transcriptional regulator with XRE-family HTH domain
MMSFQFTKKLCTPVKCIGCPSVKVVADLDRSYIASVENGQRNISIVNIEKIATALGVTIKEFFKSKTFENTSTNKS